MKVELPESFTSSFLRRLELQQIRARKSFLGSRQGGHFSLKRGHGIEFSDYRKYEPGDDPRHIDYKLIARSERVYVKRFREEQDLLVHIFIDTSGSMFMPDNKKWDRAKEIALAIAYVGSMQHDRVQLALPGLLAPKRYSGKNVIYQMLRDFYEIKPEQNLNFFEELKTSIAAAKFPGVAYFISDFLNPNEDIKQSIIDLLGKNLDVNTIQILSSDELEPDINTKMIAVDSESGKEIELALDSYSLKEYQTLLERHNQDLKDFMQARRTAWFETSVEDKLDDVIDSILEKK